MLVADMQQRWWLGGSLGRDSDARAERSEVSVGSGVWGLQKKGVLSETALPEELRLALAQNMQNDLFHEVRRRGSGRGSNVGP